MGGTHELPGDGKAEMLSETIPHMRLHEETGHVRDARDKTGVIPLGENAAWNMVF